MAVLWVVIFVGFLTFGSSVVWTACTDAARPEVNWRRCYHHGLSLTGIDIQGALLRDTSFQRTDLSEANLMQVDGFRTKFIRAILVKTQFKGSRLIEADFTRAVLHGANFEGADLRFAKFVNSDLRRANFTNARLHRTDFRNALLDGVIWIDGKTICRDGSVSRCVMRE